MSPATGDFPPPASPVPDPRKWTTRVNLFMVLAVLAVLIAGFIAVWWYAHRPPAQTEPDHDLSSVSRGASAFAAPHFPDESHAPMPGAPLRTLAT